MTVPANYNPDLYNGNGTQTIFPYTFLIFEDEDLVVQLKNNTTGVTVTMQLNVDYTVSNAGNPSGGNVTFTVAPASGFTIIITRILTIDQEQDYRENDVFPAETLERALDKLTMIAQQVNEEASRAIIVDETVTNFSRTFPDPVPLRFVRFNAAGTALESIQLSTVAGLGAVVDDPTPALGGNLNVNGHYIYSTSNGNIELRPNGSGNVTVGGASTSTATPLRFMEGTDYGTNSISVRAPDSVATSRTLVLPDQSNGTIYASGNQVIPVPDGGTGASTFTPYGVLTGGTTDTGPIQSVAAIGTAGQVLTSNGAGQLPTFQDPAIAVTAATREEMEAGTSTTAYVTPGRQQFHTSAAKVRLTFEWQTGTPTILESYNVSSLTDNGVGEVTVNFTTAFANSRYSYCINGTQTGGGGSNSVIATSNTGSTAGSKRLLFFRFSDGNSIDTNSINSFVAFGTLST